MRPTDLGLSPSDVVSITGEELTKAVRLDAAADQVVQDAMAARAQRRIEGLERRQQTDIEALAALQVDEWIAISVELFGCSRDTAIRSLAQSVATCAHRIDYVEGRDGRTPWPLEGS